MRLIRKYANRKLYDSYTKMWISHKELAQEIRQGSSIKVVDKETGVDITYKTLVGCLYAMDKKEGSIEKILELINE